MTRFDYRQSPFEPFAGFAPLQLLGDGVRLPLAAFGAALVLVTATWTIETQRLAALDRDVRMLAERERATAPLAADARRVIAGIATSRAIAERVANARRSALLSTNTIARLGNALPPQTWLTNVAGTPGGAWTIAGRSQRVAEIGATLRTVALLDAHAQTHLLTVAATGRSGRTLDFVIGWERLP